MNVGGAHYFSNYDGAGEISDPERLKSIRASNVAGQLNDLALKEATHGNWVDIPRPRPKPFVGGIKIEFLDDEWLPIPPALYGSSRVCP